MKNLTCLTLLSGLLYACQPPAPDNTAQLAFEKNSKAVLAYIEGFENENLDFSLFADDLVMTETMYGVEKDTTTLNEWKAYQPKSWEMYDFELLGEPELLPGVSAETKQPDGSVRYYGIWKVTKSATDSTEAKSGEVKVYESFDFNEEGKINFQVTYGDFGGLVKDLHSMD